VRLGVALNEKRSAEAKVIRALVTALDNAEAPPVQATQSATHQHDFRSGAAEAERLSQKGRGDLRGEVVTDFHVLQ
jgi:uncharacterized protein